MLSIYTIWKKSLCPSPNYCHKARDSGCFCMLKHYNLPLLGLKDLSLLQHGSTTVHNANSTKSWFAKAGVDDLPFYPIKHV